MEETNITVNISTDGQASIGGDVNVDKGGCLHHHIANGQDNLLPNEHRRNDC